MQAHVQKVLIDRHAIAARVAQVAQEIAADLARAGNGQGPPEITLVPILTGSIIFVSDLVRHLPLRMKIRLVSVSSYAGPVTTSQGARLEQQLTSLPVDLAGAHVLVIDDILDSGHTMSLVLDLLRQRQPASLRNCVLLRKQRPRHPDVPVDYVCFDIPDEFVVGYGLDFNDYYRNLPDLVTLRPEAFAL
jgi:hypoxanthine phosphoribosyltransferase